MKRSKDGLALLVNLRYLSSALHPPQGNAISAQLGIWLAATVSQHQGDVVQDMEPSFEEQAPESQFQGEGAAATNLMVFFQKQFLLQLLFLLLHLSHLRCPFESTLTAFSRCLHPVLIRIMSILLRTGQYRQTSEHMHEEG